MTVVDALGIVNGFVPGHDDLAAKSQELTLGLLTHTPEPFSRNQFEPGHITCTALVMHPAEPFVLFMHHHRLHRWLLPGGHVELTDRDLPSAAAREALEETRVEIDSETAPVLAGIDVHFIPPKKVEPFHLHHDLIWCFRAARPTIGSTEEAPSVLWASQADWNRLEVAESIRRAIERVN